VKPGPWPWRPRAGGEIIGPVISVPDDCRRPHGPAHPNTGDRKLRDVVGQLCRRPASDASGHEPGQSRCGRRSETGPDAAHRSRHPSSLAGTHSSATIPLKYAIRGRIPSSTTRSSSGVGDSISAHNRWTTILRLADDRSTWRGEGRSRSSAGLPPDRGGAGLAHGVDRGLPTRHRAELVP